MAFAMGHGVGFGLGFLNFLGTVLFILAIVWLVRFVVRGGRPLSGRGACRRGGGADDPALHEARERYARGEIDAEGFEALRRGLASDDDRSGGRGPAWLPWQRDQPVDVVRLRFARGELTAEEYRALVRALRDG